MPGKKNDKNLDINWDILERLWVDQYELDYITTFPDVIKNVWSKGCKTQ